MKNTQEQFDKFSKIYGRIKNNPIYFIELYYNIVHPDEKIELTDEEKQELFDQHRGIPFFGADDNYNGLMKFHEKVKKLKEGGYKDWEIF